MHRHRVRAALLAALVGITSMVAGQSLALGAGHSADVAVASGDELWIQRFNGPSNSADIPHAMGVSPDGSKVFVTGNSGSPGDYATVAYDPDTGAQLWARGYDGPAHGADSATALGVSPDSSTLFVTGSSDGSTSSDYATVAYNADTGARLWTHRYDGPAHGADSATALGVSPDGSTVVATGYSTRSASKLDYVTVAYEASTGARLWTRRYDGPGHGEDSPVAIGVSAGGAVFVTGTSQGSTGRVDFATVAYEVAGGESLWSRRYDGPANGYDSARALGASPDGSMVFVTGTSQVGTGFQLGWDYATLAYDATTGAILWEQRFGHPANPHNQAGDLEVSPSGSTVFVTGGSGDAFVHNDYATVSYNAATGTQLWEGRYNGPRNQDGATDIAVSADGSQVFVSGTSLGSAGGVDYDIATVAHDASTGDSLWEKRYAGPGEGDDAAAAMGVSPDGTKLFMTGRSLGSTSLSDYVTVAYSTP